MAGEITIQKIADGSRNVIIKATIGGDADLTNAVLFDASAYIGENTSNKLVKLWYASEGFAAQLLWDATVNVPLITLPDSHMEKQCYQYFGGLTNNAGTGKTGDILITTSGLASGDTGHIILFIQKKSD
jgi:hypothetical protein